MRAFLVSFGILIAAAWAFDAATLQGRYTDAVWQGAKYQGQQFGHAFASVLKKTGIAR